MRRVVLTLLLGCASCATSPGPVPVAARPTPPLGPIISSIHSRRETIIVRAGVSGPTYSLRSRSGELIVGDMTLNDLAVKQPELFQKVKSSQASFVWAGL